MAGRELLLHVEDISETPRSYRFEGGGSFLAEIRTRCAELRDGAEAPPVFELSAHRAGADLVLEGVARAEVSFTCGRCLTRYRAALREPFRLVLEPAGERIPAEPEAARLLERDGLCLGDELEAGWFRGPRLDLAEFFHEVLALALPVQPVCDEGCRGLCPRCGIDRNREVCSCEDLRPSSPFAALAALKLGGGGTPGGGS